MAAKYAEDTTIRTESPLHSPKQLRRDSAHSSTHSLKSVSDDVLNCSICTEPFKNPKVLPCHHTFCSLCLEQYFKTYQRDGSQKPGTFPCPVCRQIISAPDENLDSLSKSPKADGIQELVDKISTQPQKKVSCDVCKYKKIDRTARDHCTVCSINYCDRCTRDHEHHNLFQTHSVIPVTQVDKSSLKCEIHQAEHVKYYCASCLSPLCSVCAVTDHKGHRTMELQAALGSKKDEILSKINNMSERVQKQEELWLELEDIQNVRDAAVKKTKLEIERHVSSLMGQLHARKQLLLEEVERAHQAGIKQINLEKENCTFQLGKHEEFVEVCSQAD